jgi:hypothetical protein
LTTALFFIIFREGWIIGNLPVVGLHYGQTLLDLFDNPVGYLTVLRFFRLKPGKQGFSLAKPRFLTEVVQKLKFLNNSIIGTEGAFMSAVYADSILKNSGDLVRLQDGSHGKGVRRVTVNALAGTGAILPVAFWHSAEPIAVFPAGETKYGYFNAGTTQ